MTAAPHGREPADGWLSAVLIAVLVLAVALFLAAWWTLYIARSGISFIAAPLRSVRVANYGVDPPNTKAAVLNLNLVSDIIRDQSVTPVAGREATMVSALEAPVPTVTPLADSGSATSTNTPSKTLTQLSTRVSPPTQTRAPNDTQPPTATEFPPTPVPTRYALPTKPPTATNTLRPLPSDTPVPPSDTPAPPPTNTPNSYPPPPTNTQQGPTSTQPGPSNTAPPPSSTPH